MMDRENDPVADTPTQPAEVVAVDAPAGVWFVWSSTAKESINAIYPADQEIQALRQVNRNGYGHAEFQQFGQVV